MSNNEIYDLIKIKENNNRNSRERGITLITLAIAIAIIIILAGVTIKGAIGDDGIMSKASDAKDESNERMAKEIIHRIILEYDTVAKNESLENFLKKRVPNELDDVIDNNDGTLNVYKNGYVENVKNILPTTTPSTPSTPSTPETPSEKTVKVTFKAVNGTVSFSSAVVTLEFEDDESDYGVGHLTKTQIPVVTANDGYDQNSLSWSPATPTTTYDITEDIEFVASFTSSPTQIN